MPNSQNYRVEITKTNIFDACLASFDNFHNYAKNALTLNLRFLIMTCTHEYSSSDEGALFVIQGKIFLLISSGKRNVSNQYSIRFLRSKTCLFRANIMYLIYCTTFTYAQSPSLLTCILNFKCTIRNYVACMHFFLCIDALMKNMENPLSLSSIRMT